MKKTLALLSFFISTAAFALWPTHGDRRANRPGSLYWYGDRQEKRVALTFDDGPSDPYTGEILDILSRENVKGTFFLVGKNAEKYPHIAQRIVQEGHVIGNHSFSHRNFAFFTKHSGRREMIMGEEAILKATGVRPILFRPPHGKLNGFVLKEAKKRGLVTVEWTISPRDWRRPSKEIIVKRIVSRIKNGAIVLLHDGFYHKHPEDRSSTVQALPLLIHELKAQGYQLVSVPELLESNENESAIQTASKGEIQR